MYPPEHQVFTYDNSESPRDPRARPDPGPLDAISLVSESQGPNQSREPRAKVPQEQEEQDQLKLSRCLSDPGPNQEEDLSWWSTYSTFIMSLLYLMSGDQWMGVVAKLEVYEVLFFSMFFFLYMRL